LAGSAVVAAFSHSTLLAAFSHSTLMTAFSHFALRECGVVAQIRTVVGSNSTESKRTCPYCEQYNHSGGRDHTASKRYGAIGFGG